MRNTGVSVSTEKGIIPACKFSNRRDEIPRKKSGSSLSPPTGSESKQVLKALIISAVLFSLSYLDNFATQ